MTLYQYIEQAARSQVVENLIKNILHTSRLSPTMQDLAQTVYEILLTSDADKMMDLFESGDMKYFLVRIVTNNLSEGGQHYRECRKFSALSDKLGDYKDEG